MIAAKNARRFYESARLAVLREGEKRVEHRRVGELIDLFQSGDLLVVNSSATLPSSFTTQTLEIRLASFSGASADDLSHWRAVLFGQGDWRTPTEKRGSPPRVRVGDCLRIGDSLSAVVTQVDPEEPRLIDLEFQSPSLIRSLYEYGRPIQYSYLESELDVWDQQTLSSTTPLSVEPPSASFQLTWKMLLDLKRKGVQIASVLHGAGLSSTGQPSLDQRLPLDEYFEVPEATMKMVKAAKRVIAVGTSACRALESSATMGVLRGRTILRIDAMTDLKVTDALLTGMHEPETSHFDLMGAFGATDFLARETESYRSHEYGDLSLLFAKSYGT